MTDERFVTAQAIAACPFSIAEDYAREYLQRAEGGGAEAAVRVPIRFLPPIAQRRVDLTFGLFTDVVEGGRPHNEIHLRWSARSPLLPSFAGTLRFRIEGSGTLLSLAGSYHVPMGSFGAAFDRALGARIAGASVSDFLGRLAASLETREQEWRTRAELVTP